MISVPRPFLFAGAGLLGVVYLLGRPADSEPEPVQPCRFAVSADVLNVRSGPGTEFDPVDRLTENTAVTAQPVEQNGFRQLGTGRWVAQEFLVVEPDSSCP